MLRGNSDGHAFARQQFACAKVFLRLLKAIFAGLRNRRNWLSQWSYVRSLGSPRLVYSLPSAQNSMLPNSENPTDN